MKSALIAVTMTVGHLAFSSVTFTNVNEIVLGLEFATNSITAGERLEGNMVVSNASAFELIYNYSTYRGPRDTIIGDFVVADEAGIVLPKTVPSILWQTIGSGRQLRFRPGQAHRFDGDVVYGYSLTNPGTYLVKAIAVVPTTNAPTGNQRDGSTMVIETLPLTITVLPRPAESPPAKPLYNLPSFMNQAEVALTTARALASVPELKVTPPTANPESSTLRTGSATPKTVSRALGQDATTGARLPAGRETTGSNPRNLLYGSIVFLGVAALGLAVWRARRKEHAR